MKLDIQSIHFDADRKLLDFIKEKTDRLTHFHDGIIEGNVFLRIDKSSVASNKVAEIRLHISGHDLFAKKQCKSFEEAVDTSLEALTKQLKKHTPEIRNACRNLQNT